MKIRSITKTFDTVKALGYKNLIVGGCSFTYNNSETTTVAWPYYLRDIGGFNQVYDCSIPSAGNQQISSSVQWALENHSFDPADTMVIAMWSGHTRSGHLRSAAREKAEFNYRYQSDVWYHPSLVNNDEALRSAQTLKNYLDVLNLKTYLTQQKYSHVFLDFMDYSLPNRANSFDITEHLPLALRKKYQSWFAPIDSIYRHCLRNDLLHSDDYHPSPDGHLSWVKTVFMPWLATNSHII